MAVRPQEITTPAFCDMHVHLRQGPLLEVAMYHARYCQQILAMPNTVPPLLTADDVVRYRDQVDAVVDKLWDCNMVTHFALYINEQTTPEMIREAKEAGVMAGKVYPKAATTHSDWGVMDYDKLLPVFAEMQNVDMVLCLHGETPKPSKNCTVLDWEREFVCNMFPAIAGRFPSLRVVLEHITTKEAVECLSSFDNVAATITAHHLYLTIDDILAKGIQPLNYCKPVAKMYDDLDAIRDAAWNPGTKFMFGSDSAPHDERNKFCACGAAGCFTAPHAFSLVTDFFDDKAAHSGDVGFVGELREAYKNFTFQNAVDFYRLEDSGRQIVLQRDTKPYAKSVRVGATDLPLFWGGRDGKWSIKECETS